MKKAIPVPLVVVAILLVGALGIGAAWFFSGGGGSGDSTAGVQQNLKEFADADTGSEQVTQEMLKVKGMGERQVKERGVPGAQK
jgi:flagellar basal body-associated protein FliL